MEIQLAPEPAPEEGADTPAGLWFPLAAKLAQWRAPEISKKKLNLKKLICECEH